MSITDLLNNAPTEEPERQYYFIAEAKKIIEKKEAELGRKLTCCVTTFGCQMNARDSEKLLGVLKEIGYVETTNENADFVIAFVHWGTEGNANYGADQTALARSFVEAGADAIIGGHTHCLQTVEYMDDVPIYYSLGNYWFATTGNMPIGYDTGLAQLHITPEGKIESYFIPCHFDAGVTSELSSGDSKYTSIIDSLNLMSQTATIDKDGHISKK